MRLLEIAKAMLVAMEVGVKELDGVESDPYVALRVKIPPGDCGGDYRAMTGAGWRSYGDDIYELHVEDT